MFASVYVYPKGMKKEERPRRSEDTCELSSLTEGGREEGRRREGKGERGRKGRKR